MTSTVASAAAGIRATDEPQARLHSKVFWRIVPFLMLCYVIAYLDRVKVGFAKLQMRQDLGFSDTVFGLGAGMFFVGYFLFAAEQPADAQDMLDALTAVAGTAASKLARFEPDAAIAAIVGGWPARFDNTRAQRLGLKPDPDFVSIIRQFLNDQVAVPQSRS